LKREGEEKRKKNTARRINFIHTKKGFFLKYRFTLDTHTEKHVDLRGLHFELAPLRDVGVWV